MKGRFVKRLQLVILILSTVLIPFSSAFAISAADLHAIKYQSVFYDDSNPACYGGGIAISPTDSSASKSGTWTSGIAPSNAAGQYPVETYIIEVLKDIAAKQKGNAADYVTKQHIIAMMGFGWGEGGNLTNDDIWNLWNNGIDAPDLVAGGHSGSGLQSFKSFDAGVEANARRFSEPGYSRLVNVLSNPTSTTKDFAYALTYFKKYPGNVLWAGASATNPDGYYQSELNFMSQAGKNYDDEASTALGPPGHTQGTHLSVKLQFGGNVTASGGGGSGSGSGSDVSGDCDATNAGNGTANAIVQAALSLAWPTNTGHTADDSETPAYKAAFAKYNDPGSGDPAKYTDCGRFVSTVMHLSGADTKYPLVGTVDMLPYVHAHPEKFDVKDQPTTADLQPGDILVYNQGGEGHTMIYLGAQGKGGYIVADASWTDHTPELNQQGDLAWMLAKSPLARARVK